MSKYFKLFANCIAVKGYNRSIICDLQRGLSFDIPNEIYFILNICKNNVPLEEIKSIYDFKNDIGIDKFLNLIEADGLGFYTNNPTNFINLSEHFEYPGLISNCIIDIEENSKFEIQKVVANLEILNCSFIHIRIFNTISIEEISTLLNNFKDSCIRSIELLLGYNDFLTENNLIDIYKKHTRVLSINVHSSPFDLISQNRHFSLRYLKQKINSESHCGIISEKYFSISVNGFMESLKFNSCLNNKISIDSNGNIRNCPSMKESFGNIKDTTLSDALNKQGFKKYWNIKKDDIAICKDCEFRHICTDCRAYIENPEDIYSKPLKCGYNPYTNEWQEWSTNPLKQKAIEFYGLEDLVIKT
ncbi:MAG: grasp-with-spasm system SPASM domain peptide maturase [Bacteroidota bacterium]